MPPIKSNTLRAYSPGKLNLTFDILGDLPGGYHEVETLMQTVDIEDELIFTFEPASEFSIEIASIEFAGSKADVPTDQNNLITKAANLYTKNFDGEKKYKVTVQLKKAVPVAGGMGGGSGNAAATLMVLNKWFDDRYSDPELKRMASQLGADVPFFIDGGTQIGVHRGDVLSKVNCKSELSYLIVGPKLFGMQTAEVYGAYDQSKNESTPRIPADKCAAELESGTPETIGKTLGNAFESVVFARKPELKFIVDRLSQLGGICTRLTGSGPTLYVLTADAAEAQSIQSKLKQEQQSGAYGWNEHSNLTLNTWIAKSTSRGVRLIN
ncbi:MAG: 4-(cytidine 5'-diphospho)-2-C-methyl-D-erythritol kinase [Cyanobacteria bacterium SZAS-4]|nr:4-(cytidine 5'-diphospho)-2-C-methyl-D-erythritol kinase [Cyanobacteria bacterium SZAS-4]